VSPKSVAYGFRITLRGIAPPVWRQIEVPATCSLWDLHVAIQDAMGWKDCHLHAFRFDEPEGRGRVEVGTPNDDPFEGGRGVPVQQPHEAVDTRGSRRRMTGRDPTLGSSQSRCRAVAHPFRWRVPSLS